MAGDLPELRSLFEGTRELFFAFGDPRRQDIVLILNENPTLTVRELAEGIGLSRPATSHHLRILRLAGLVGERQDGRRSYYYVILEPAFERLRTLVEAVTAQGGPTAVPPTPTGSCQPFRARCPDRTPQTTPIARPATQFRGT